MFAGILASVSGGRLGLDRSVGIERRYAVTLRTRAVLPSGDMLVDARLAGELAVTVIATAPELVLRVQYTSNVLELAGSATGGANASSDTVSRALAAPLYVVYGRLGEVVRVKSTPDANPFATGILRELATASQLGMRVIPARAWQATEQDVTGAYVADYELVDGTPASPRRVSKRKRHYVDATAAIVVSDARIELDDRRTLRALQSAETVRTSRGPLVGLEVTTDVSLRYASAHNPRTLMARWKSESRDWPTATTDVRTSQQALDRAAVEGWQYETILGTLRLYDLAKIGFGKPDKARAAAAYAALTGYLRLHPDELEKVRGQIVEDAGLANTLIAALRDAGSPPAQALLRDLLGEERLRDKQPRLVRALSLVAHPTEATVATLRTLQSDPILGVQACYGLGSALHRLRDEEPHRATQLLDYLVRELAAADSLSRTVEVLNALGNGGHPGSLNAIAPYLAHGDEQVRAAAARALRRIPDPAADDLLRNAAGDATEIVRAAAIEAFSRRSPSRVLAAALIPRLVDEPAFSVRAQAVHLATDWLPYMRAELAGPLAQVAMSDASADLRRVAQAALP